MNLKLLPLFLLTLSLVACTTSPADEPRSVAEYMADNALAARTLEACRFTNMAEFRMSQSKPACRAVREAERQRQKEEWNAGMAAFSASLAEARRARRGY